MSSAFSFAGSYLFGCLWLVPFVAVAGWSASRVMRRLGPAVQHRLWVLALLGSVLLPALPLLLPVTLSLRQHAGTHAILRFAAQPAAALPGWTGLVISAECLRVLLAIYGAATLLFVFKLLRSLLGTLWLVNGAAPVLLTDAQRSAWQQVSNAFNVTADLLSSHALSGPVTVAGARPLLLLPESFAEQTSEAELRVALAHECAHIVRRDFVKNLAYELVSLPVAFHPVSWWIKAQLAQSREMLCDEIAVQHGIEARTYRQALLRLATLVGQTSRVHTHHAIGIFDANILEKRIMELQAGKRSVSSALRLGLFITGAVCLPATVAVAMAAPVVVAQEGGVKPAQTEVVYQVGKDVKPPELRLEADPEFPPAMRNKGPFSGTCTIGLTVDSAGVPQDVHVVHSVGRAFDKNALEAVRQYRFKPGTHNGVPVPVALFVDVKFQSF